MEQYMSFGFYIVKDK